MNNPSVHMYIALEVYVMCTALVHMHIAHLVDTMWTALCVHMHIVHAARDVT